MASEDSYSQPKLVWDKGSVVVVVVHEQQADSINLRSFLWIVLLSLLYYLISFVCLLC